ncbi:MAG: hypothetical protein JST42_09785, partial [Bacteroidetes bacterium]|nr:hypothetical protein [Bacteroidota bacterium]
MHPLTTQGILKGMLTLPLSLYRGVSSRVDHACNWAAIHHKKVTYSSFPVIKGRIRLYGGGVFIFGKDVKFNCSVGSNYVGLYKTCTVAVLEKARLEIGDHSGFSGVSIY